MSDGCPTDGRRMADGWSADEGPHGPLMTGRRGAETRDGRGTDAGGGGLRPVTVPGSASAPGPACTSSGTSSGKPLAVLRQLKADPSAARG